MHYHPIHGCCVVLPRVMETVITGDRGSRVNHDNLRDFLLSFIHIGGLG